MEIARNLIDINNCVFPDKCFATFYLLNVHAVYFVEAHKQQVCTPMCLGTNLERLEAVDREAQYPAIRRTPHRRLEVQVFARERYYDPRHVKHTDDGELCGALKMRRLVLVDVADGIVVDTEDMRGQSEEGVRREVVDARPLHRHVSRRLDVDSCEQRVGWLIIV